MTENNNKILPNIENESLIQMTIPEYITQKEKITQILFLQNYTFN